MSDFSSLAARRAPFEHLNKSAQHLFLLLLNIYLNHSFLSNNLHYPALTYFTKTIVSTNIASVMSSIRHQISTIRTSHLSGSRWNSSFVFSSLVPGYPSQSSVPNRVQNNHRICGSAFAVQPRYSSRLRRNVKNNGRQKPPIRVTGFSTPQSSSLLSSKLNWETSTLHHKMSDVSASSRWLWPFFWQ